jgi:hypothetical protein
MDKKDAKQTLSTCLQALRVRFLRNLLHHADQKTPILCGAKARKADLSEYWKYEGTFCISVLAGNRTRPTRLRKKTIGYQDHPQGPERDALIELLLDVPQENHRSLFYDAVETLTQSEIYALVKQEQERRGTKR